MKLILYILIIISGVVCKNDSTEKKQEEQKNLFVIAALQANASKPVDTRKTCQYKSTGGTTTNVFLTEATDTNQNLTFVGEDLGFGLSLQSYSMIRVTTAVNGKLTFSGSNGGGIFSVAIYTDAEPCSVNAQATASQNSVYTASTSSDTTTLTFNQASTFLVLASIAFNSTTPAMTVSYSD